MVTAIRLGIDEELLFSTKYGLNIYWVETSTLPPSGLSAETVFITWYQEGINYDYSKEPENPDNTSKLTTTRCSFDFFIKRGITLLI